VLIGIPLLNHCQNIRPLPVQATLRLAAVPAGTTWFADWAVMTGGSGSVTSTQIISGFSFVSVIPLAMQVAAGGSMTFSWPASAGGYVLQEATSLATGPWTTVSTPVGTRCPAG